MSDRPSTDLERRPARSAMNPILGWTVAGVAVPAILLIVPSTLVVLASLTTDDLSFADTVGMLLLALVMVVPPGAVCGALIGLVDFALRGYVARGRAAVRRARSFIAAAVMFTLLTAFGFVILIFTASDMSSVAYGAAVCGAFALVPAIVAHVLYRRLPGDGLPVPRPEAAPAPHDT